MMADYVCKCCGFYGKSSKITKGMLDIKDIAIIIPCYKAMQTLSDTLNSIAIQTIIDNCTVYLCVDNDGIDYSDIISRYNFDIKIINSDKNVGAGLTRQNGIEYCTEPYIVFIDSDDMFYNPFALENLYVSMTDNGADIVVSNFYSDYIENGKRYLSEWKNEITWLHGKMYRRQFLTNNHICFNNMRLNEDGYFNQCCLLCRPKVIRIEDFTYLWLYNSNSLTRKDDSGRRYNILYDYINVPIELFKFAEENDVVSDILIGQIVYSLIVIYFYYNEIMVSMDNDKSQSYMEQCKKFYKSCYSHLECIISDEELRQAYTKTLNSKTEFTTFFPAVSFYDFCKEIGN